MKKAFRILMIAVGSLFSVIVLFALVAASNSGDTRPATAAVEDSQPASGVTMANYNRIQDGMTYAQVVAILGRDGQEMSSNNIAGIRTAMYQWTGRGFANMNAMFQNGKLIQKAQFGLQ